MNRYEVLLQEKEIENNINIMKTITFNIIISEIRNKNVITIAALNTEEYYNIEIITNESLQVLLLEFTNDHSKEMMNVESNERKIHKCISKLCNTSK